MSKKNVKGRGASTREKEQEDLSLSGVKLGTFDGKILDCDQNAVIPPEWVGVPLHQEAMGNLNWLSNKEAKAVSKYILQWEIIQLVLKDK